MVVDIFNDNIYIIIFNIEFFFCIIVNKCFIICCIIEWDVISNNFILLFFKRCFDNDCIIR